MGRKFLVILGVICLMAVTSLLTLYLQPKKVQAEEPGSYTIQIQADNKTIQVQEDIIDQLRKIPPSPQGLADVNEIATYQVRTVAATGSMLPTMNEKSKLLLAKVPVAVGDIITFQNGTDSWVHRIIAEDDEFWYCQGDANKYYNQIEFVPKNTEIWRVMGILY